MWKGNISLKFLSLNVHHLNVELKANSEDSTNLVQFGTQNVHHEPMIEWDLITADMYVYVYTYRFI